MGRHKDKHAMIERPIENVLPDQDARLDRLAEADFIGQQIALNGVLQHPADDFDLMIFEIDHRGEQAGHARAGGAFARPGARTKAARAS